MKLNPDEIEKNKKLDELREEYKEVKALSEKKKKEEEDEKERLRQEEYIRESKEWIKNEVIDTSSLSDVKHDPNYSENYYANIEQQENK